VRSTAIGSGRFHEKACGELKLKRFTFLREVWSVLRADMLPDTQASLRTRSGVVNGSRAVQEGIQKNGKEWLTRLRTRASRTFKRRSIR